jgi:hypothetical protein
MMSEDQWWRIGKICGIHSSFNFQVVMAQIVKLLAPQWRVVAQI